MSRQEDLELARKLASEKQLDQAYAICDRYLSDDPNDVWFLTVMVYVMLQSQKHTIAYHLAKRAAELCPTEPGIWMNLGMAANDLWLTKEARKYYERGLKLAKGDKERSMLSVNIASVLIDTGHFKEAEPYCHKAIELQGDTRKGRANLGFCQLARGNFEEGWENYRYALGSDFRMREQYNGEPEWDGKGEGTIVLYAEQGLGDVISFGSMLPDMQEWADKHNSRVILDVDPRLKGLFQRTFPRMKVYGTRGQKVIHWDKEDHKIDYSLALGQIGEYFRDDKSKFGSGVYLTPDPVRVFQWKSLFQSKGKPVIGIAWRGGILRTGAKYRQWDLEQLLPILESTDAHWVSLQYKPAGKEIAAFKAKHPEIDIVEYPHGTLTHDYDDTCALTAALDMVICMQTAIGHVAGALGKPAWVFLPKNSQWRYGQEGEDYVWAKSIRIIRQSKRGVWDEDIERIASELPEKLEERTTAKQEDTRAEVLGEGRQAGKVLELASNKDKPRIRKHKVRGKAAKGTQSCSEDDGRLCAG